MAPWVLLVLGGVAAFGVHFGRLMVATVRRGAALFGEAAVASVAVLRGSRASRGRHGVQSPKTWSMRAENPTTPMRRAA